MSAAEVIAEIRKLPPQEREEVYRHIASKKQDDDPASQNDSAPRSLRDSYEKVFADYEDVFRKLAQ
jgi:hypothetical protein